MISDRPGWPSEGECPDMPMLVKVFQASRACDGQARWALLDQTLLCCLIPLIVKSSWALLSWWCWKASFNRSFLMQNFQRIQGLTLSSSSEVHVSISESEEQNWSWPRNKWRVNESYNCRANAPGAKIAGELWEHLCKCLGPIHSCHKWLWNTPLASRAVLGAGDRAENQTDEAPSSWSFYFSGERQYMNSLNYKGEEQKLKDELKSNL